VDHNVANGPYRIDISVIFWVLGSGFGGLGVACWPLVPKFADSNPAEAVGFLRAKKILSKPSVPCRRLAACKRSLNVAIEAKFTGHDSRPRSSTFRC
jgi:hypothetical protein